MISFSEKLNFRILWGLWCGTTLRPEVPQSPDARLSKAFVVRGFISMISKIKIQE